MAFDGFNFSEKVILGADGMTKMFRFADFDEQSLRSKDP